LTPPGNGSEPNLEEVACALCGAEEAGPILQGRDLRRKLPGEFCVVRCASCGLAYVNPRPTEHEMRRYYPSDYGPHDATPPSLTERVYYRLFRKVPAPPGSTLLDVGCGGGKYLSFLRERGYRISGIEVNAELAEHLRSEFGLQVYEEPITRAPIPEASFDVVTLWWVLEHTHDPLSTLRAAHRALRPGGTIVVSLQNFASIGRLLFGTTWHHLDVPSHLYHFEPRTLRDILRRANFEVLRVRQDLIAKDFAPSLGQAFRLQRSLDWMLPNLLALPFDLVAWSLRRSGLITAYATRS